MNLPDNLPIILADLESRSSHDALSIYAPNEKDWPTYQNFCVAFAKGDCSLRQKLHVLLADYPGIKNNLVGFAYQCAEKLMETGDETWLRTGLAAIAMAERSMDYRDMLLVLAELYVVAEEAGLDPIPAFREVEGRADFDHYAVVASRRSGTHVVTKKP